MSIYIAILFDEFLYITFILFCRSWKYYLRGYNCHANPGHEYVNEGISWEYGRTTICILIILFIISYVKL